MTRSADILIVAIGRPKFITAEMVKPGAVVIDVGMNRTEAGLVGDVDFAAVKEVAGRITPVPGGVGLLTVDHALAQHARGGTVAGCMKRQKPLAVSQWALTNGRGFMEGIETSITALMTPSR